MKPDTTLIKNADRVIKMYVNIIYDLYSLKLTSVDNIVCQISKNIFFLQINFYSG